MTDPINVATTVALLSTLVALVVERIRHNFPRFHGDLVTAAAWAAGIGLAVLWDLRLGVEYGLAGIPAALDYVVTGGIIAGVAGLFGEAKASFRRLGDQT